MPGNSSCVFLSLLLPSFSTLLSIPFNIFPVNLLFLSFLIWFTHMESLNLGHKKQQQWSKNKNATSFLLHSTIVHIIWAKVLPENRRFVSRFLTGVSLHCWARVCTSVLVYLCTQYGPTLLWLNSFLSRTDTESPNNIRVGAESRGSRQSHGCPYLYLCWRKWLL